MKGGLPPLLLAVFTVLVRSEPQVKLSTTLNQTFTGDLVYLRCDNATDENTVQWYLNNMKLGPTGKYMKIPVASSSDSGSYQCESNGVKSQAFTMDVSDFTPSASLTIHSGQPVMPTGATVNLMINNEEGVKGWLCWSYKRNKMYRIILKKVQEGSQSHVFETRVKDPETIIWCTSKTEEVRSNQITLRTSDKDVFLEMYPHPAVVGESLTLKCMVWGTDQIKHTVFYMNDAVIVQGGKSTYEIPDVTDSTKGNYKCKAVYTYRATTGGPPRNVTSDSQEVFVTEHPITAVLRDDMTCSCSSCPSSASYRYYKKTDQSWVHSGSETPTESGTFRCRAVWNNMRSYPSASVEYKGTDSSNIIQFVFIFFIVLGILLLVAGVLLYNRKKRQTSGAIYEDVALKGRDKDEDKYQELKGGRGREAEYDTLKPEAVGRERKEGEYEPLKKDETKEGVYHTLGMEGAAAGGDGGYEALKKGETKEGVYHTLGKEGAEGGDGGYEALKKGETKAEVYHTLRKEGADGGDGGYEALTKVGTKDEVYHTLGKEEGAEGGDGGYEALKKVGTKDDVYHTLGKEGAEGGKEEVGKKDKESEAVKERKEEI